VLQNSEEFGEHIKQWTDDKLFWGVPPEIEQGVSQVSNVCCVWVWCACLEFYSKKSTSISMSLPWVNSCTCTRHIVIILVSSGFRSAAVSPRRGIWSLALLSSATLKNPPLVYCRWIRVYMCVYVYMYMYIYNYIHMYKFINNDELSGPIEHTRHHLSKYIHICTHI